MSIPMRDDMLEIYFPKNCHRRSWERIRVKPVRHFGEKFCISNVCCANFMRWQKIGYMIGIAKYERNRTKKTRNFHDLQRRKRAQPNWWSFLSQQYADSFPGARLDRVDKFDLFGMVALSMKIWNQWLTQSRKVISLSLHQKNLK